MPKHELHRVMNIELAAPYQLRITFEDGAMRLIDFSEVLYGVLFSPLREVNFFNRVALDPEVHTIVWPNGAVFDPETLYNWDRYLPAMKARMQSLASA